jgi:transaldolase / glucose-6-phosphate isomerase
MIETGRYNLPDSLFLQELERLKTEKVAERILNRDHTVWKESPDEIENRLGWLDSPVAMVGAVAEISTFAGEIRDEDFTRILLLGMGGSSLAPEVFRKVFGQKNGFPDLQVLDSTDPGAVLDVERSLEGEKTLFIISTKSGGTVETFSFMKYFYNRTVEALGKETAGRRFIAITDPGSGLEQTAKDLGFRKTFLNDPNIGGRYSSLSYFGLVPFSLIGQDPARFLESAAASASSFINGSYGREDLNPAWLGAVLGALGKAGRDKLTLLFSPSIESLGTWIEQLIAESTGKEGKGLLPVDGEKVTDPANYANDRIFIYTRVAGENSLDEKAELLIKAGHPLICYEIENSYALGGEMFRWMMATAVAGWSFKINPFDQPNVESAKVLARSMVEEYGEKGELPALSRDLNVDGIEAFSGFKKRDLHSAWLEFLKQAKTGENGGSGRSYIAIQAYLKPAAETDVALQVLREELQKLTRMAVTVGYGPRFLHSTGQLHKGDAGNGLFVQLTGKMPEDIPVPDAPGSSYSTISFGVLKTAQALGDRQALLDAGRKVIRFHFKIKTDAALQKLSAALKE